ncbi:exoribonuclease-2 [Chitinivorax tropicus]|uniref:Exoribonuclease-2 n=1 Tax=Chitinivorax tropicus TaxID=714531 RepID=A0A840MJF9_9PROT|nr:RNB domain-containing ribonuclease [Chitinivorax tropicus]MBB5019334.1 exoribonuclease-2 [Chitinivorax tropicus]
MNVFYEEDGSFKVGNVMQAAEASFQVEAISGKRSKIKAANVLLKFNEPSLAEFMPRAEASAEEIDIPFLWECCGEDEFGFEQLAEDYFGHKPSAVEAAAVAIRLHAAPMYFYRKGKGRYKAAPADTLKAALAGLEKKRLQAEQAAKYVEQLAQFELPDAFKPLVMPLLFKPDKNTLEFKALDQACKDLQISPLRLFERCGALPDAHDYHLQMFLLEYFPKGTGFPPAPPTPIDIELPIAEAPAFSLDDSSTTEIDDAFTVQPQAGGGWRVGVHIAAPTLGILPDSPLDQIVMQRLSTVYFPGNKYTMLPDEVVQRFTLQEGQICPTVSMYIDITADFDVIGTESRVEQVRVAANLRNDVLEAQFNDETLANDTDGEYPFKTELRLLWQFACALEKRRGKYDPNRPPQVDYNFHVENDQIRITTRKRGSPIDKLVSELMIFVNCEWGGLLGKKNVPGIYRAQANGKVRMTTNPAPHQGLGVPQYAWSSSPLRRAVDLINQRQLLAVLRDEPAPYPKGSSVLFEAMRDFDATYNAYLDFQDGMERYWCLRWLKQENITDVGGVVLRDGQSVRLTGIPLVTKVAAMPELSPGTRVELSVGDVDYLSREVDCKFKGLASAPAEMLADDGDDEHTRIDADDLTEQAETTPTEQAETTVESGSDNPV